MNKAAAVATLGEMIVEVGKGGEAFGPIVTLVPLLMGDSLGAEIDALPADASTGAKAAALQTLIGIVGGSLLTNPKFAAQTKAALKGLMS